jgi:hypothetical protein
VVESKIVEMIEREEREILERRHGSLSMRSQRTCVLMNAFFVLVALSNNNRQYIQIQAKVIPTFLMLEKQ